MDNDVFYRLTISTAQRIIGTNRLTVASREYDSGNCILSPSFQEIRSSCSHLSRENILQPYKTQTFSSHKSNISYMVLIYITKKNKFLLNLELRRAIRPDKQLTGCAPVMAIMLSSKSNVGKRYCDLFYTQLSWYLRIFLQYNSELFKKASLYLSSELFI